MKVALRSSDVADVDSCAIVFQGFAGGFEHLHHLEALEGGRQGLFPALNAIQEVLAFCFQRLRLIDIGGIDIAVMVGIVEFRKRVIMGRHGYPLVVYPYFFNRLVVIEKDHPPIADKGHPADLAGVQPAGLYGGKTAVAKIERHIRDVFHPGLICDFPWQLTAMGADPVM